MTTLRLADQMIERCADMHLVGILHNDIKPQNFVMGLGAHADVMYVLDFGLADRLEYDPVAMAHILQSSGCGDVKGTKAFQSMRAHQGYSHFFLAIPARSTRQMSLSLVGTM